MRTKKEKVPELFFTTFVGEYVRIVTTVVMTDTIETEEGISTSSAPLLTEGYLLDYDDNFYYLGQSPDNVTTAISRHTISQVQSGMEQPARNVFDEILESMPDKPDSSSNIN